MPVFREETIVAIFGVGNKAKDYDQDGVEMVTALGDLVWDIILRRRAEEGMRQSGGTVPALLRAVACGHGDAGRELPVSFGPTRPSAG